MVRVLLLLSIATTLAACAPAAPAPTPAPAPAESGEVPDADPIRPAAASWAESTLERLTLRQKVGQLLSVWVLGDYMPRGSEHESRLLHMVREQGIGGVITSVGQPLEVADKLNRLQQGADVPLIVSADMEHGPGQRLAASVAMPYGLELGGGTSFPPAMAIGATGDPSFAYDLGRVTAVEARAAGVHMAFAPVADVNNNPANPIINTRSYGGDPGEVARFAAAHARGLEDHAMMATAKHFPGHGDTGVDSHIALPFIFHDRARVDSVELVPFRAVIDAGATAVMTAHIAFPELTGDSITPATLSPAIITGLLREELGFDGLVVTDALSMGAIVAHFGTGEAAVRALEAGADQLLMPPDVDAVLAAVEAAVRTGRIAEERLDRSVLKILRLKEEYGLHRSRTVPLDSIPAYVGIPEHIDAAQRAADRSITLVRDERGLVPLGPRAKSRVLSILYTDDADPTTGREFHRTLREAVPTLRTIVLQPGTGAEAMKAALAAAADADIVLFSPVVRVSAAKAGLALPAPVADFTAALSKAAPLVVTSFGNPYLLDQLGFAGTYMLAWGHQESLQRAAARALLGRIPITGKLPIPLPPHHPLGHGIRRPAAAPDVSR